MLTRPVLLVLSIALLLVACRPTPSDPIEYLHREDSIIIQMLTVDADASEIERRLPVPEFTLYGDGTLIYQSVSEDGTRLLETRLPTDAVRELLEGIVDEGFLDFIYEQPAPEGASRVTTFVYAHTRDLANAVSIRGADDPLTQDAGDEFDQYRTVQAFAKTLRSLDPVALGASQPADFLPASLVLQVMHIGEPPRQGAPPLPPAADIDFAQILPEGFGPVQHGVDGDLAARLWSQFRFQGDNVGTLIGPLQQGSQTYLIAFVPLLPFYENFPEFNLQ